MRCRRAPGPSRGSRVRGGDARVAARELDYGRQYPGGRRAGTLDPLMMRLQFFFRCACRWSRRLSLAGCSAPLPSTELPPARYIQPAPEFPGFFDYRGIVDLPIKTSGMDQAGIADLAKAAQIDFIFLADRVQPDGGESDFGIAGFTNDILFISGGAFEIGGSEIIGVNIHDPIKPNLDAQRFDFGDSRPGRTCDRGRPGEVCVLCRLRVGRRDGSLQPALGLDGAKSHRALLSRDFSRHRSFPVRTRPSPRCEPRALRHDDGRRAGLDARGDGRAGQHERARRKGRHVPQLFLFCTTHLIARARDSGPILEALRLGHSYASFDYLGYVGTFAFFAHAGDTIAMMGDEIRLAPGLVLKTELPAPAIESRCIATALKWRRPRTHRRSNTRRSRRARTESRPIAAASCGSCLNPVYVH